MTGHRGGESILEDRFSANSQDGTAGIGVSWWKISFCKGVPEFLQSPVLYLTDSFLGQPDQGTDLGKCQTTTLGTCIDAETVVNDFLFYVAQISRIVDDDVDGLGSPFKFVFATTIRWFIRGFERRIELCRESLTILRVLHSQA
jgi:hypothetical protein